MLRNIVNSIVLTVVRTFPDKISDIIMTSSGPNLENMDLDAEENLADEILSMSTQDIQARTRLMDNEVIEVDLQINLIIFFKLQVRIMKSELGRLNHELQAQNETIKDNEKKIKQNKVLPYLVSNIIEVLEVNPEDEEEIEGANVDLDSQRKGKSVVIKTTTR